MAADTFVPDDYAEDLKLATQLADLADELTMAHFLAADLVVQTKPDRTPVTEADQAVERAIAARLATQRPDDALVGEEFGASAGGSGRTWVIDPIDGTANFLRGVPVWASLIALVDDGQPVVGMVSAPALGRRWWAAPGLAATGELNGGVRRLSVSAVEHLSDASLSFSDAIGWPSGTLQGLQSQVWRTRAYGDFWSHVLVAEGAVDVAIEPELQVWDVAALVPIIAEAGGRCSSTDGGPVLEVTDGRWTVPSGLVSSNGTLHAPVLEAFGTRL